MIHKDKMNTGQSSKQDNKINDMNTLNEFLIDHEDVTKNEKRVAEDIIKTIQDDIKNQIPVKFTVSKIQENYKLKEVPLMDTENSLWYEFTKDEKIGANIQGYRQAEIDGKKIRIPYIAFGADLDYLDEMMKRIITKINQLKMEHK